MFIAKTIHQINIWKQERCWWKEILPDGEDWIYESKYTFQPQETSDSGNNMDYPHDYPFDYYNGMSSQILLNEAISDADFEMVVYGPCENPEILIGNHKYHVNCQLETGEYLVINSLTKKIYKVKNDGEQVNQYNLQDRDWYVFQKIASGSHSVFWSGLFGFDITLYERRSEQMELIHADANHVMLGTLKDTNWIRFRIR